MNKRYTVQIEVLAFSPEQAEQTAKELISRGLVPLTVVPHLERGNDSASVGAAVPTRELNGSRLPWTQEAVSQVFEESLDESPGPVLYEHLATTTGRSPAGVHKIVRALWCDDKTWRRIRGQYGKDTAKYVDHCRKSVEPPQ